MASLKQTQYVREAWGAEAKSTVYYIDIRAIDRFEDFYQKVQKDPTVTFRQVQGGAKSPRTRSGDVILHGVDTEGYHRYANAHDLAVLAIGMEPERSGSDIPADIIADSSGFIEASATERACSAPAAPPAPLDVNRAVQSATAAALRAIQVIHKAARAEA